MTVQWLLTVAACLAAAAALVRTRRLARRLERLTESYWDLRYEQGQLKARLARIDPDAPPPAATPTDVARQQGAAAFVPLSSLKR